jgi:hypothetical protein
VPTQAQKRRLNLRSNRMWTRPINGQIQDKVSQDQDKLSDFIAGFYCFQMCYTLGQLNMHLITQVLLYIEI